MVDDCTSHLDDVLARLAVHRGRCGWTNINGQFHRKTITLEHRNDSLNAKEVRIDVAVYEERRLHVERGDGSGIHHCGGDFESSINLA